MRRLSLAAVDDRGVSATVTHALALSITAILISGLLLSANAVLADQRENAAREQLHTIGNRMASDLSRAASLAQDGGNVTIHSRQPGGVAGRNYNVEFLTGSDCSTDLFDTDACLRLSMQSGRPTVMVPVRNASDVSLDRRAGGRYVVSAVRNESAQQPPAPDSYHDLDLGIGAIGGGVNNGTNVNATNRQPIAGFTFTPGTPSVASVVEFRNDTNDLDGVIETYEWNFNAQQDDTVDATGRTANYSYSSMGPGKYTVELTVTDDDGASDSVRKVVSVGGVVYNKPPGVTAIDVSPSLEDGGMEFSITNLHGSEVEIQQVLIDPANDSIDYLDAENEADEVWINGDDQTGTFDDGRELHDGGRIFDLADDGDVARLSAGSSADVEFMGFDPDSANGGKADMSGEEVFVAMHYVVNGSYYTAQFTLNGAGSGYNPADPSFDVDCTDKTCDFTDTSSGTIASWQWNITDGAGYSDGYSTQHVTGHTFPANGTYDVTLAVTDDNDVTVSTTKSVQIGSLPGTVEFAVNAGGPEVTTGGVTYERDTSANPHGALYEEGFSDSTTGSTGHTIPPSGKEDLYQSVRYGDESYGWSGDPAAFGYDANVPNGEYLVTYEFAEIYEDYQIDVGDRVFDVRTEGNENVSNLDVYDDVGDDQGLTVTRTEYVTDGELTIRFQPDSNIEPPMVSAVVARLVDPYAFQEDGSDRFVMEAENFHDRESGSYDDASGPDDMSNDEWVEINEWGDSGSTMRDEPDNGDSSGDTKNGPRMDYYIDVPGGTPTTYYVWVRMECDGTQDEGVHVGIDGQPATYGGSRGLNSDGSIDCHERNVFGPDWIWVSHVDGTRATITVNSAGEHTVNVWAYSDGVKIDKIVLAENAGYTPTGDGPDESDLG